MDNDQSILRYIYLALAAVSGSIVSLSFMPWQTMSRSEKGMAVFVGSAFALFGVPWIVATVMGVDMAPLQVACGVTFFGALGAPTLIPKAMAFINKKFDVGESGK